MSPVPRLRRLVLIDRSRALALGVVVAAVLAFHGCAAAAGSPSMMVFGFVVVALVLVCSLTDGISQTLLLGTLVWDWLVAADSAASWWSLPAAACLLIVHSASSLVAGGPDMAVLPRRLVVVWCRRTAVVAMVSSAFGAVILAVRGTATMNTWLTVPVAIAAIAAVTVTVNLVLRRP